MAVRPTLIPLALALLAAGCSDATGPRAMADRPPVAQWAATEPSWFTNVHILRQAPTAPGLETYQLSFWAYKGEESTVAVNYLPAAGQSVGQPFLRLYIPKNGLLAGAGGESLKGGDSVLVTLTIDSLSFSMDFQPSGVGFSNGSPGTLLIWYQNANPDLNGDGVVDGTDETLQQQLALWYQSAKTDSWLKLSSDNDPTLPSVSTELHHFCQYAVSW